MASKLKPIRYNPLNRSNTFVETLEKAGLSVQHNPSFTFEQVVGPFEADRPSYEYFNGASTCNLPSKDLPKEFFKSFGEFDWVSVEVFGPLDPDLESESAMKQAFVSVHIGGNTGYLELIDEQIYLDEEAAVNFAEDLAEFVDTCESPTDVLLKALEKGLKITDNEIFPKTVKEVAEEKQSE